MPLDADEVVEFTHEQARKVGGISASVLQSMVNKLHDMARSRKTTRDDIVDVVSCLIACTTGLVSVFAAVSACDELELIRSRLKFICRDAAER